MRLILPQQANYAAAVDAAWAKLVGRPGDALVALGAAEAPPGSRRWNLPVLDADFQIDLSGHSVTLRACDGMPAAASVFWTILTLHYLVAPVPVPRPSRVISFEDIPSARGYAAPYSGRVIGRFCGTVGRDRARFLEAAEALGGRVVDGGDLAVRFDVFPLVPLTILWYGGDEELPPGASFLYQDNVASIFEVEDIVVTAERLVSRLCGKPW